MTENVPTDEQAREQSVDEPSAGGEGTSSAESEPDAAALREAEARAEENWNKYLRVVAEMENLRKRAARDAENARKYAIERFATELLAVVDSLEMGLEAGTNASVDSLLEGKAATLKLLAGAMEKFDISVIDPAGEPFDPQLHEAMTMQPSDTAEPGSVLSVIQKGYLLNDRLLRPARVVVAAAPESGAGAGQN